VSPLLGAVSDKLVTPCGRRRPFIVLGQLCILLGLYYTWASRSYWELVAAFNVYAAGCTIAWVPWMTILPEIVTEEQRGLASGIQSMVISLTSVVGSGMGVLVGEAVLSLSLCYLVCIVLHATMLPLGWVSVGIRPGWCAPEVPPPPASRAKDRGRGALAACKGLAAGLCGFFSAFAESAAFAWLFAQTAIFAVGTVRSPPHCSIHPTPVQGPYDLRVAIAL
jgi:MFS family permease